MFKLLQSMFALVCYAAADDYKIPPATVNMDGSAHRVLQGLVGTTVFRNVLGNIEFPFNDSVCAKKNIVVIHSRTSPVGDANYASLPTGSICLQCEITSTVLTDLQIWIKGGTGASDWRKILASAETTSATAYTSAKSLTNIRGTNSGTGDFRAVYARISLTHASAGSGEAVRGYGIANGGVNALRGAHLTGEVGTGGSVVGLLTGATVQFSTASGLTLSGGTAACLDLVSDLSSAVTGMTVTSFIRCSENQSNKLPSFVFFDSSATGCIGATTAATAAGTIKVNHAGTIKYLQMYSAAS